MGHKTSLIQLSSEQYEELDLCPLTPGWRVIPRDELPAVFPDDFRVKIDSAIVITAETDTGGTYLVYNARRIDFKDRAVDMEPFGLIVHSTGPSPSGMFLHHGNWEGRSEVPPDTFWDEVTDSGIGSYFLARPPIIGGPHL